MEVKIIRSSRRKKTVNAREVDDMIYLYLPMGLSDKKESEYIKWAKKLFESRRQKKDLKNKKAHQLLESRARKFNRDYFRGKLSWNKIEYSVEQNSQMFANCNITDKSIRMSHRLLDMPKFVHDYVLIHELAHLEVPGHGKKFWELVNQYPRKERAIGYLMAIGRHEL
ncbi:MAG: M48 family metallopeptidase [Candidatus Omnitrophica bacterium]|nr:M48 family metallopeptidase [Candidatus Omnitrophota bacterium]